MSLTHALTDPEISGTKEMRWQCKWEQSFHLGHGHSLRFVFFQFSWVCDPEPKPQLVLHYSL